MLELAKRLTLLTPEQIEEVQTMILRNKKEETVVEDNDGSVYIYTTRWWYMAREP